MYAFLMVSAVNAAMLVAAYLSLFGIVYVINDVPPTLVWFGGAVGMILILNLLVQLALTILVWSAEKSSLQKWTRFSEDG